MSAIAEGRQKFHELKPTRKCVWTGEQFAA